MAKHKSKIYLFVFSLTALILAWGAWVNYRPTVILASCSDIAYRTSSISTRYSVEENNEFKYDQYLQDCLTDAGYDQ